MMILIPSNNSFYSPDHPWVSQRSKSTNTLSSQATPEDYEGRTEKTGDKFTLTNDTDGQYLTRDTVRPVSRVCLKLWVTVPASSWQREGDSHGPQSHKLAWRCQVWETFLSPTSILHTMKPKSVEKPILRNPTRKYPTQVLWGWPTLSRKSSALWLNVLLVLYTFHAILFFV